MSQAAPGSRARDQRPAEGRFLAWGRVAGWGWGGLPTITDEKRYLFHRLDASVSRNSTNEQV